MPILKTATYTVQAGVVAITFPVEETVHLNADMVQLVIDNIRRNRAQYGTEQAFQDALSVYKDALSLLKGGQL